MSPGGSVHTKEGAASTRTAVWEVALDTPAGAEQRWARYEEKFVRLFELCLEVGVMRVEYMPGETQSYVLDFVEMTQTRSSTFPGYGTSRKVRRYIPASSASDSSAAAAVDAEFGAAVDDSKMQG